jgi:hypothetical protein
MKVLSVQLYSDLLQRDVNFSQILGNLHHCDLILPEGAIRFFVQHIKSLITPSPLFCKALHP